jgi:hypothetical protein
MDYTAFGATIKDIIELETLKKGDKEKIEELHQKLLEIDNDSIKKIVADINVLIKKKVSKEDKSLIDDKYIEILKIFEATYNDGDNKDVFESCNEAEDEDEDEDDNEDDNEDDDDDDKDKDKPEEIKDKQDKGKDEKGKEVVKCGKVEERFLHHYKIAYDLLKKNLTKTAYDLDVKSYVINAQSFEMLYNAGEFERIYNLNMKLSKTIKTMAKKPIDECFELILKEYDISYSTNIYAVDTIIKTKSKGDKGYVINYVIPKLDIGKSIKSAKALVFTNTIRVNKFKENKDIMKISYLLTLKNMDNVLYNILNVKAESDLSNFIKKMKNK